MAEILQAPAPYGLIKEADGLIQAVETVNKALITRRRTDALAKIDKQITALKQELDSTKVDAGVRSACLTPLETLKTQVTQQDSLAHITQAEQEAVRLFDAGVAPKPIQVVKPVDLMPQAYLESEADIDAFLDKLRKALKAAVSENKRIQIR